MLRPMGAIYYANARKFRTTVAKLVAEQQGRCGAVVVCCAAVTSVDLQASAVRCAPSFAAPWW